MRIIKVILSVLWLSLAVGFSIFGLYYGGEHNIAAGIILLILSSPAGYFSFAFTALLISFFEKLSPGFSGHYDLAIEIFGNILAISLGYLQWFVLVPKLFAKIKNLRESRRV